ncbi:endo alpha-1,4 polygalactosaminidase [Actinoplanes missouriensis]|uniref:endo alpha-1,4 polygalactosaminidase n=1 Tax=Actinoplanes missouriensis TaxID=1866 RepID=UPI003F4D2928
MTHDQRVNASTTARILTAVVAIVAAGSVAGCGDSPSPAETAPASARPWTPPPAGAGFDYQLGGTYPPPAGVTVVSRDREAPPAAGLYNVCYVNAYQAQPGAEQWWETHHPGLLLRDSGGDLVIDEDWDEALLDFSTAAKRAELAAVVGAWIDRCAADGFQAVEADNLDSYTRSRGMLSQEQAIRYATTLNARAHAAGLASGQKNTAELSGADARAAGFDFAVTEECAAFDECDVYTASYGDHVLVVEYTRDGFAAACDAYRGRLSIVLRDRDVSTPDSGGYVRDAC